MDLSWQDVARAYFAYLAKEEMELQKMARKREKNEDNIDLSKLPPHLQNMDAGYSALEHMCETPMTNAVLKSLRKKSADISFLCGTMCDAAVQEGSKRIPSEEICRYQFPLWHDV
eukprot:s5388_g3.t1